MEIQCGIYEIRHIESDLAYFGSTKNWYKRKRQHLLELRKGTHDNPKLQSYFNKHGEESMDFRSLMGVHEPFLLIVEQMYISNNEGGFNIAPAAGKPPSALGLKRSDETKAKMSAAGRGRKYSPEGLEALREASRKRVASGIKRKPRTGQPCPEHLKIAMSERMKGNNYGALKTTEGRKLISEARKRDKSAVQRMRDVAKANIGRTHTEEAVANMSEAQKKRWEGKSHTDEAKARLSAANTGRKPSPETRAKLSEALRQRWIRWRAAKAAAQ